MRGLLTHWLRKGLTTSPGRLEGSLELLRGLCHTIQYRVLRKWKVSDMLKQVNGWVDVLSGLRLQQRGVLLIDGDGKSATGFVEDPLASNGDGLAKGGLVAIA